MESTTQINLDQERTLKLTQAAKYRMSESGAFIDLQTEGKEFSAACKTIAACLHPYNPRVKPETVAEWMGDKLPEVMGTLAEFLGKAFKEEADPEKKPGSKGGRSSSSK